MKEDDELK